MMFLLLISDSLIYPPLRLWRVMSAGRLADTKKPTPNTGVGKKMPTRFGVGLRVRLVVSLNYQTQSTARPSIRMLMDIDIIIAVVWLAIFIT
jgi:hypothetical protein